MVSSKETDHKSMMVKKQNRNMACALLFTLFSAQFLGAIVMNWCLQLSIPFDSCKLTKL